MLEPKEEKKIFVYGSLRTGFYNYDKYLKGKVKDAKVGKVKGKLYHMPHKGYPALLEGEDVVFGEVMTVNNFEEVMISMDKMESYYGANDSRNEYNRIVMDVELENGETESCYCYYYAMNDEEVFNEKSIYVENGDWTSFMIKKTS
ncbi:MAG: gamma-glutamylcyclotransferase family protein [Peptostreptococcaceae bacterium]